MLHKIAEFLGLDLDDDRSLVIRLFMVIFGVVVGTALLLLSFAFSEVEYMRITLLSFGCVTFGGMLIGAACYYIFEEL